MVANNWWDMLSYIMSCVWIWAFVQETVFMIQLPLLLLLLHAAGGWWLLACVINNWFPPDYRHTMLKVFYFHGILRKYCHWFFSFLSLKLWLHFCGLKVVRCKGRRRKDASLRKNNRKYVGVKKEERETVRQSNIHWSSVEEATIKWSHSSGKWSTPNAMWRVVSLGLFQAYENQRGPMWCQCESCIFSQTT